jgi:hypothetical protein
VHGPATPQNIDRLLGLPPLGLSAAGWVSLFFGDVEIPAHATITYDDVRGVFVATWADGAHIREVDVDPETARFVRAALRRGTHVLSEVMVKARDSMGLVEVLRISATPEATDATTEIEVRLRDVERNPELDASVFVLDPPKGVQPEYLGQ